MTPIIVPRDVRPDDETAATFTSCSCKHKATKRSQEDPAPPVPPEPPVLVPQRSAKESANLAPTTVAHAAQRMEQCREWASVVAVAADAPDTYPPTAPAKWYEDPVADARSGRSASAGASASTGTSTSASIKTSDSPITPTMKRSHDEEGEQPQPKRRSAPTSPILPAQRPRSLLSGSLAARTASALIQVRAAFASVEVSADSVGGVHSSKTRPASDVASLPPSRPASSGKEHSSQ